MSYTDPSGHWAQFLDDAVDSAVNFGKKVVNKAVEIGRSAVNTVTSFFTGSSSTQTSASGAGTSPRTIARSGRKEEEVAEMANCTVKNVKPAGCYGSSVKCHANLSVKPMSRSINVSYSNQDDIKAFYLEGSILTATPDKFSIVNLIAGLGKVQVVINLLVGEFLGQKQM